MAERRDLADLVEVLRRGLPEPACAADTMSSPSRNRRLSSFMLQCAIQPFVPEGARIARIRCVSLSTYSEVARILRCGGDQSGTWIIEGPTSQENGHAGRTDMSVIRFLGLGLYSTETLGWIMVVILCASLVMGWIADALLEKLGFGVVGNVVLCLIGHGDRGCVVWNFYISPAGHQFPADHRHRDVLGLRMPADLRGPAPGAGLMRRKSARRDHSASCPRHGACRTMMQCSIMARAVPESPTMDPKRPERDKPWIFRTYAGHSTAADPTRSTAATSPRGRPASPSPSTFRRRPATTPTTCSPRARSARSACRSPISVTCGRCSRTFRSSR